MPAIVNFEGCYCKVREPLASIASRTTNGWLYSKGNYINRKTYVTSMNNNGSLNLLLKALQHWVTWNSFIELVASHRYQVEQIDFELICELGGTYESVAFTVAR